MKTLYVSSTDRDMAGERELLHRQVIPTINQTAREFGQTVELCDLRRSGQTRAEAQSDERLLSVCLDEIDRCSPYMIVLVGQRYGQFLSDALRQSIGEQRQTLTSATPEMSLAALEIQYGALDRKDRQDKVLFYFRQIDGDGPEFCRPESEAHAKALEDLKEKIRAWAGDRVKTYHVRWDDEVGGFSGLDDFAAMVEADLKTLLEPQWTAAAKQDAWARDMRGQWELVHQRARDFTCRNDLMTRCMRVMEERREPVYLLGAVGSGKSTLMGKLAQEFERRGDQVLPVFCGFSDLCRTATDILRYIIRFTEDLLGIPQREKASDEEPVTLEQLQTQLTGVLTRYSQEREEELVILLVDTDQLLVDEGSDSLSFLPQTLPERVKLALSCTDRVAVPQSAATISVEPLSDAEVTEMAQGILRTMKLELEQPVIEALVKKPETHNPLYLRLLLHRMTLANQLAGKPETQAAQHRKLIHNSPGEMAELYLDILEKVTRILGDTMVVPAGAFLAISCHGLRDSDLEGIFRQMHRPWDSVSFVRFQKLMGKLLFRRSDGRTDLRYHSLRQTLLNSLPDRKVLHRAVMEHLLSLSAVDSLRVGETVWHALNAKEYKHYVNYISTLDAQGTALEAAAKDTAIMLRTSGGEWLLDVLKQGLRHDCGPEFFTFLDTPLGEDLGNSQSALRLHRDILLATVRTAEQRAQALGDEESWRAVTACRNRAGRVCYRLGDAESLALVAVMQEQQLTIAESLLAREDTPARRRKLMAAYAEVATLYEKQGGTAQKRKALALQEKRLLQWQTLTEQEDDPKELSGLAEAWEQCAEQYAQLGEPEDREKAQAFREQAMLTRQTLANRSGDPADWHSALVGLLPMVTTWGETAEGRPKALALLEQSRDRYLALEDKSPEAMEDLARIWFSLGELWGKSRRRERLLKALEMYQESFLLYRALTKLLPTAEIRIGQACCYERMGEIYGLLGGTENLQRALELLNRSLTLRRKLHGKLDTADTALALALALHRMGRLCAAFGGEGNLLQARKILESALPLHQRVEDESSAAETHKEMIELRCAIAEIDADLAAIEEQRRKEEEERRQAQLRLEEEERAMEEAIRDEDSDEGP